MSLNDICYEQIKGNFWWGIFGDFKLIIDKSTGYFNATKLCASGGKHYKNWLQNQQSQELLEYLASDPPAGIPADGKNTLTKEILGGNCEIIRGTYVCDDLILAISSWISPEFYVKCNRIVKNYFVQDFNSLKTERDNLENRMKEIEQSLEKLTVKNQELENTKEKLTPLATPYTKDPALHNCFVLIKKNSPDDPLPYYCIRKQKRNLASALKKLEQNHPNLEIIYSKEKDPNSMKLYRLMIEELPIETRSNSFSTTLSEKELIREIDKLYASLLSD